MTVLHWVTKGKYGRHQNNPSRLEWERHHATLRQDWIDTPADPMQFHLDWVAAHKEFAVGDGLPRLPADWQQKVPPEQWKKIRDEIYNYQQPDYQQPENPP